MFLGEFQHCCDSKNRLRIPTKFKKEFSGQLVICKGNDGCLFVLPKNQFEELFARTSQLPMFDSKAQKPLRMLFSSASEVEEDNQGRFLLPSNLKAYAHIEKDVVFVGVGSRIELWSQALWQEYTSSCSDNFDSLLGGLGDYGI